MAPSELSTRPAISDDRRQLDNLIHFEPYVHRHLDWRRPLDWIGHSPFWVVEKDGRIVAALACPQDPAGIAWLRIFAVASNVLPAMAWELLWPIARERLENQEGVQVCAIVLDHWMMDILEASNFRNTHNVILLAWQGDVLSNPGKQHLSKIRALKPDDLPEIYSIDRLAFSQLWQNSYSSIELAYEQSVVATVLEDEKKILGYQISTPAPMGGHLARLAVHPGVQGRGIGYALVFDAIRQFEKKGALRVTVNTQIDNYASRALYKKARFKLANEEYPVYQYRFDR